MKLPTLPNRPVVAIDVDGTIARYHEHFLEFIRGYVGPNREVNVDWDNTKDGEFSTALGMDKTQYRQIKLAYRSSGAKRTMPLFEGAKEMINRIHEAGAEVWFCTTRPWQRMDNIDPDTQEFFERNNLDYNGLIYGDDKYETLIEIVGKDRIVAVLDDLPEQYLKAESLGLEPMLRLGDHNRHIMVDDITTWRATSNLFMAGTWILRQIKEWKEKHINDEVLTVSGEPVKFIHNGGRVCKRRAGRWVYGDNDEYVCTGDHGDDPKTILDEGDDDRGEFGMPGLGVGKMVDFGSAPASPNYLVKVHETETYPQRSVTVHLDEIVIDYGDDKSQRLKLTAQGNRVIDCLVDAIILFAQKNHDYGDTTGDELGAKGQYADMHRKWKKLKKALWDDEPLVGESVVEILQDFVGHIGLTMDFLGQEASEDA